MKWDKKKQCVIVMYGVIGFNARWTQSNTLIPKLNGREFTDQ